MFGVPEKIVESLFDLRYGPFRDMGGGSCIPKRGGKKTVDDKSFPFITQFSVSPCFDGVLSFLYSWFKVESGAVYISENVAQEFIRDVVIVPVKIIDTISAVFKGFRPVNFRSRSSFIKIQSIKSMAYGSSVTKKEGHVISILREFYVRDGLRQANTFDSRIGADMGSQNFCGVDIEGHGQGTALSEPPVQADEGSEPAIDFNRACD